MLSNCAECKYFDHHPHHTGDTRCAVSPAYTLMWRNLKSLDESTLDAVPVDSCRDFELNPSLEKQEIDLALTFQQWQKLIRDYDCPQTILDSLKNKLFHHSLSLSLGDWQAIANSTNNPQVLDALAEHDIEPDQAEESWINVDSSCISAIAFHRPSSKLTIRFNQGSVYEYSSFTSDTFDDFLDADSKGRFFVHHIKDQYSYSHIGFA